MHSSTVFKSGLVTRLNSVSWQPSNNHIYTQPFRKGNTHSITFILTKGPTPSLSSLSPWRASGSYATFAFFPIYYIFFLSNSNTHFDTKLRLGAADSFENDDFLVVKHSQNMTQFWLKFIFLSFRSMMKFSSSEISSYIYPAGNTLFRTLIGDQDKHWSLLVIYFLSYT